jgi:hypothetical protein
VIRDQWRHDPAMMRELYESNLVDGWKNKFYGKLGKE